MRQSSPRHRTRPTAFLAPLLASAFALATLTGCDGTACIFSTGNCITVGTPVGALGAAAALPSSGSWILPTNPSLVSTVPSGAGIDTRSPIVLRFNESLSAASVTGAFQVRRIDQISGVPIPLPTSSILVGDGRLLVLAASTGLTPSTDYDVITSNTYDVRDLTGQPLALAIGAQLTSFTTAATNPVAPRVLATYPQTGAFDQSETGEIVVVFDRTIDSTTLDDDSWDVKVELLDPLFDPVPTQALGAPIFGVPTPEPRVWRWRSVDATGAPSPLGRDVDVVLSLSTVGSEIKDLSGGVLPPTEISFRTASVLAPGAVRIVSSPNDAIGIAALTPGSASELAMEVDVDSAVPGDRLDLYIFGPNPAKPAELLAIRRVLNFTAAGPVATVLLDRALLDLAVTTSPLVPRFADGSLTVAASFTGGPITTPVTLLDIDTATTGIQSPVLDTLPPIVIEFDFPGGGTAEYWHTAGDVVFEGRASERLTKLEISTGIASTPADSPVFARDLRFASMPLDLGVLPPGSNPLPYSIVAYDRAGNPSVTPIVGELTLRGFASDVAYTPGGSIEVAVYDARTLAPIEGAVVLSHADPAGPGAPIQVGSDTTDTDGNALVAGHGLGEDGTIVTVLEDGYDMASVHLFGSAQLSIGLYPTAPATAAIRGTLASTVSQVLSSLTIGGLAYLDGRRPTGLARPFSGGTCSILPFGAIGVTCPFGPSDVAVRRSGSLAAFNGVFALPEVTFTPVLFLSTYALAFPLGPINPAAEQLVSFQLTKLLTDPSVPPLQSAIDLGMLTFDASGATGLDLGALDVDATFPGEVRVHAEANTGGSTPPVAAGIGASYDQGGGLWNLRGAWAGEVSAALVDAGLLPLQRLSAVAELVDTHGARSGVRTAFADLLIGPPPLVAPPVPVIASPAPASNLGSGAFEIEVANALVDGSLGGALGSGLYHLRLVDSAGRTWHHYRPDVLDADGNVVFFAPDLSGAGKAGLAVGAVAAQAEALAFATFDPLGLYFSDLETRPQRFATGAPVDFTIP